MKIALAMMIILFVGCSTPERPKDEDTKMLWQEDKSIEEIFADKHPDDGYHTRKKKRKADNFWPGKYPDRSPASEDCDCGNNKYSNYRSTMSLDGVNKNGLTNQINSYKVRDKHETLMLIAYKIYGDYSLWRVLADLNQDVLRGSIHVTPGMRLKYYIPQQGYSFVPEGNPFLVRKGQSLSIISDLVYRDWRRWKQIYSHNQPFIRNPNLIYEGSTIFYVPDSTVASKGRVKFPVSRNRNRYPSSVGHDGHGHSSYQHKHGNLGLHTHKRLKQGVTKVKKHESYPHAVNVADEGTYVIVGEKKSNGNNQGNSVVEKKTVKVRTKKKSRALTSRQVERETIIPVQEAAYSKNSLIVIGNIKKAIENTHGNTEINGSSKFDKYIESNFVD